MRVREKKEKLALKLTGKLLGETDILTRDGQIWKLVIKSEMRVNEQPHLTI